MHYIRELTEQGIIKVEFVRSGDNTADIFTKNLPEQLFLKHKESLGVKSDLDSKKEGVKMVRFDTPIEN